jgi:hypothetical protein
MPENVPRLEGIMHSKYLIPNPGTASTLKKNAYYIVNCTLLKALR